MDSSIRTGTPLRQRMIDDMRMRKLEHKTRRPDIRAVCKLAAFLRRLSMPVVHVAAETLLTIAADAKHLGPRSRDLGAAHLGISTDPSSPRAWHRSRRRSVARRQALVACRPGFFLPVRVLSRLFRRSLPRGSANAHRSGQLQFFGDNAALAEAARFSDWLASLRAQEWVVYAKRPFAGPAAVLAYLSRYTHRVAISNRRLVALDERGVSFRWKDYRAKGKTRYKTMTLSAEEFMRRFLLHVLPSGFHRIRHYGLIANAGRRDNLALARELLQVVPEPAEPQPPDEPAAIVQPIFVCRDCGAPMTIIVTFTRGQPIRAPPAERAAA